MMKIIIVLTIIAVAWVLLGVISWLLFVVLIRHAPYEDYDEGESFGGDYE